MREICTSGSVGGEDGDILAYPALSAAKPIMGDPAANAPPRARYGLVKAQ
jgi:hypothetical protein